MAKILTFFPRQVVIGNPSSSGTYYSEVFDVSDAAELYWEFRLHATHATGYTGTVQLEDTEEPSMSGFASYGSTISVSGAANTVSGSSSTIPKRYMRAKLTVSNGGTIAVSFVGRSFR